MPASVTTISSGAAVTNADIQGNLDAIEAFLAGGVTGADLSEIQQFSVPASELIKIGGQAGFDSQPTMNTPKAVDDDTLHELDTDGQWDFHTITHLYPNSPDLIANCDRHVFARRFINEFMGDVPIPQGHLYKLNRCLFSWNDWRYALDEPGTYASDYAGGDPGADPRRPTDEYWTLWKCVPGCADLIYVPEEGNLYITGFARGTFNAAVRDDWFSNAPGEGDPPDPPGNYTAENTASVESAYPSLEFRLFVEARGEKNKFDWTANGRDFRADWAPVGDLAEVAVDDSSGINVLAGHSAGTQSWPRADVILHGAIHLPGPGWYLVSMKLNNRYWYGYDDIESNFVEGFYKNNESIDDAEDVEASEIGPMSLCRWESARMQTMFQPLRSELSDTATHQDFYNVE